jgi:ComF family protein
MGFLTGVKNIVSGVSEIIYPNHCQLCNDGLLGTEVYICSACAFDLPYIEQNSPEQSKLSHLFSGRVEVVKIYSLLNYQKGKRVTELLHQVKYHGKQKMGEHFGEMLAGQITDKSIDLIVPVPLHVRRMRQRGYNQSTCIANGIGRVTGIPVAANAMKRKSWSQSQTKFSKYDRWENVRAIFEMRSPEKIMGKHILIVDDVLTTGATVEACAREMLAIEGVRVSVGTLAARV